jgi:hypothetical protein
MVTASGTGLKFEWSATRGKVTDPSKSSVIYIAPDLPGPDNIIVKVTAKGGAEVVKSFTMQVISPTPTPTPTLVKPTDTPSPTITPKPTVTSTATHTPQVDTLDVPPLEEIFSQVGDGHPDLFMGRGGELIDQFAIECAHTGKIGLKLTYKMQGDGYGGWLVSWGNATPRYFDASSFLSFVIWVKGGIGGETFQIGIKDITGKEVKIETKTLVIVSTTQWKKITISLSKFADEGGQVNMARINNINIGLNKNHGAGSICLDDIAFVQ